MALHIKDIDTTQADFQDGTLTDVVADSGGYLRLEDTDVLSFDGTDDYVDCGLAADLDKATFSIEMWIYPRNVTEHTYVGKNNDASANDSLHFGVRNTSVATLAFFGDDLDGVTTLANNTWYFISGTFDYSTLERKIYLNGSLENSDTAGDGLLNTNDDPLLIMFWDAGPAYGDAIVSEFRIWETVLTQTEIQDNMNKRLTGNETGLVAYYKLDEGTGTTATDSAGSNDGTINGATWVSNEPIYFMNSDENNNRLSPQIDLSAVGTVDSTSVSWTETLNGETITIETRISTDNGTNWTAWATCTNGGSIPDLTSGLDVSNGLLECRQTLSTSNPSVTPQLEDISLQVNSQKDHSVNLTVVNNYAYSPLQLKNAASLVTDVFSDPQISFQKDQQVSIDSSVINILEEFLATAQNSMNSESYINSIGLQKQQQLSIDIDFSRLLRGAWFQTMTPINNWSKKTAGGALWQKVTTPQNSWSKKP